MSTPHFTSREMKAIMKISDCELMHLRTSKQLSFIKKAAFEIKFEPIIIGYFSVLVFIINLIGFINIQNFFDQSCF